ncbi:hypothetical protein H6P81_013433 [Aristolochia fimbriata]|uniref:Uncharacterized protein n=1 Tax=Aristolochia fimbriata TaxID=158543 RepID=A0AAV7EEQ4_ARIFI|nr:hypothetical protein H6P81_013433 [Aristolochia fimbriata]
MRLNIGTEMNYRVPVRGGSSTGARQENNGTAVDAGTNEASRLVLSLACMIKLDHAKFIISLQTRGREHLEGRWHMLIISLSFSNHAIKPLDYKGMPLPIIRDSFPQKWTQQGPFRTTDPRAWPFLVFSG